MEREPFVLCNNLVKIYKVGDHDVMALQGLDLIVWPGELLGMVGVSGSGKSTLMNILGGLDQPSAGQVWVDGHELLKMDPVELNRFRLETVGFVWQQGSRNLIPYLNALENVELPLTVSGRFAGERRRRAEKLLDRVGLFDRRFHRLTEMSGGEQQRVAIAVGLSNDPRLLLADEPTGEVDETTAQQIYDLFRELNNELNLTTMVVSHDTNLAHHVDRVIAIRDGKIASEVLRVEPALVSAPVDGGVNTATSPPAPVLEELTVLDSAGRLQVPKDYLEKFNIRGRARLELTGEGILIRPAPESDSGPSAGSLAREIKGRHKPGTLPGRLASWLSRLKGRGNGRSR